MKVKDQNFAIIKACSYYFAPAIDFDYYDLDSDFLIKEHFSFRDHNPLR